jgi:hypothetical protein
MVVNIIGQINPAEQMQNTEQANNSAVVQELNKIDQLKQMQQKSDDKAYDKLLWNAKHLEALRDEKVQDKALKDHGVRILSNLMDGLSSLGIADISSKTLTKSTTNKIEHEFQKSLDKTAMKEDKHEVTNRLTREAVRRSEGKGEEKHEKEHKDARQLLSSADVSKAVQSYSGAYAQYVVAASPEARNKLEDAQEKLRKKGFSDRDMMIVERSVKRSLGNQVVSEIQDSFIQHMFSPKKTIEYALSLRKFNNSYKEAMQAGQMPDISEDPKAARKEMAQISEVSSDEIREFVRDAVESKLMERHISGRDNITELRKLMELGHRVGFDLDKFLKTWEQKKFDLGIFALEAKAVAKAENKLEISIGEVSASGVGEKNGYEMTPEEEKELLINQLRAELMKRAITGDPFAVFSFAPKIRKLKNGLIKLGLFAEDFQKIEKEAKVLARLRTLEMLVGAFVERSTYFELSGPAFRVLNNKLKGLISNLENLDITLTREELDVIRDEANRNMYDHAVLELRTALAYLESHENPSLEKKVPMMVKLIERLREESGFQHNFGENLGDLFRRAEALNGVKEHA